MAYNTPRKVTALPRQNILIRLTFVEFPTLVVWPSTGNHTLHTSQDKEGWEIWYPWYSCLYCKQLNCYILDPAVINHTESHRRSFALLLLPPARVHFRRAAAQKKRRENTKFWWCYSFLLTIFSINSLLLIRKRDLWYWSPQTVFCSAVAATRLRSLQQSGKAKRTVRKHKVLMMLQFFYSPFFQLIRCF